MHKRHERSTAMMDATSVQNSFIREYMPKSPEGYVKVYLYGLMLGDGQGFETMELLKSLGISEKEALEAYKYWQKMGLVCIMATDPLDVEYCTHYAIPYKGTNPRYDSLITSLDKVCGGRVFSPQEISKIYDWIDIFGMDEAVAVIIVRRCIDMKGKNVSMQYMDKAAKAWADEGILTPDLAEQRIHMEAELISGAKAILDRWHINRRPTEPELGIYRKWTMDWGMTREEILAACPVMSAADKPTFGYLNGILDTMRAAGGVKEYLSAHAAAETLAHQMYLRSGIQGLPTKKERDVVFIWLNSWHVEPEAILYAAELSHGAARPFVTAVRIIETWHAKGILSLMAARDYECRGRC